MGAKADRRRSEAREEARSMLLAGYAAMLGDDSMREKNPAAVSMAGFMMNYIGNRRYEEVDREEVEEFVLNHQGIIIK
jgi:hypothetical protein